jgi:hypothetical protein
VAGGHIFRTIGANGSRTCGLKADGTIWCWPGSGGPIAVSGSLHFDSMAVAISWGCGVADDGLVYCMGDNSELGVTGQPAGPVPVTGQGPGS